MSDDKINRTIKIGSDKTTVDGNVVDGPEKKAKREALKKEMTDLHDRMHEIKMPHIAIVDCGDHHMLVASGNDVDRATLFAHMFKKHPELLKEVDNALYAVIEAENKKE